MGHDLINRRSLDLNRLVAEKIRRQPELMEFVRKNLEKALKDSVLSESCKDGLREWEEMMNSHSTDEVLSTLVADSEEGQRMRQSTPFWGILSQEERREIFSLYEPAGA